MRKFNGLKINFIAISIENLLLFTHIIYMISSKDKNTLIYL